MKTYIFFLTWDLLRDVFVCENLSEVQLFALFSSPLKLGVNVCSPISPFKRLKLHNVVLDVFNPKFS